MHVESGTNRLVPRAIDLGPAGERVFLLLYGTGIRGKLASAPVRVTMGGLNAVVSYAGPQGEFAGLDQVNVLIPVGLRGRGDLNVVLAVDGLPANIVRVRIQ